MLLAVDAGNTNTVFALFGHRDSAARAVWRFASARDLTSEDWLSALTPHLSIDGTAIDDIDAVIVASVVPGISRSVQEMVRRYFRIEAHFVHADLDLGITIDVDEPYEVGADRLVNAAYAYAMYGGPTTIVDLGTATKFEAITADGRYLGGAIAPGLAMSLDALASRAARLYAVELVMPARVTGRSTTTAVQAGVVTGHLAMIEGILQRMAAESGAPRQVILTGGLSPILAGKSPIFTVHDPDLTLRGLAYLHARVSGK